MHSAAKTHVMVLSNSLNIGGAQRFAGRLICGLDRSRLQPQLVLLQDDIHYRLPDGVPVRVLGYRKPKDLPAAVWRLRRLIRRTAPDVVLGVGTSVNVVAGCALLTLGRRPAWIARVDIHRRDMRFRKALLGLLYPMADAIVANSTGLRQALMEDYARQRRKIGCLPNPVDFKEVDRLAREASCWKIKRSVPLLVTLGRAYPAKRWDILLDAFSRMVATTPAELAVCGDGPLLNQHKQRARQLNLQDRVHFLGHCDNPFPLLAQADLFVFSSEAEGLPNALIEAQGMGLCAVATRCEYGPEEIIGDGVTGKLVPVNDAAALADAMRTLIEDRSLRDQMGRAAAQQARRRFDFASRCKEWEAFIVKTASVS